MLHPPPSSLGYWLVYKFKLADLVQKLHCACIMNIGNVSMSTLIVKILLI